MSRLSFDEIEEKLNTVEGGAEIMAAIKAEITSLRNEAKSNRIAKSELMKQLGIEDGTDTQPIAALVAALKAEKQDPSNVMAELSALKNSVNDLNARYEAASKAAAEAETKRLESIKTTELITALTDSKAVSPTEIAKLLAGNVKTGADGALVYMTADGKELSVKDGVTGYLRENPWAAQVNQNPGGGTKPPTEGVVDYENMSMADYIKQREAEIN